MKPANIPLLFTVMLVLCIGFFTSCSPPGEGPSTPSTATISIVGTGTKIPVTATPAPSTTFSPTPPSIPTSTDIQVTTALLSPSATATVTPQQDFFAIITAPVAFVREGPNVVFHAFANLGAGLRVRLIGRDETGFWFLVDLRLTQFGWVSAGAMDLDFNPEERLPELADYPEIPTVTPTAAPPPRMVLSLTDAGRVVVELINFPGSEDATFQVFDSDGKLFGTFVRRINHAGYLRETILRQYIPKDGLITIVATSTSGTSAQNSILIP